MAHWEDIGLRGGVWQGIWHDARAPARISLVHLGRRVGQARIDALREGAWRVTATLPADLLTEGATTLLLVADGGGAAPSPAGETLATLPIIAGRALDSDLRAEIDLLRAELDLLKREFRHASSANG